MVNYENNTHYNNNLNNIQTGDVIFVKGNKNSLLNILIRLFGGSWFIHSAILIDLNGIWFVIETKPNYSHPYQIVPLDWWLLRNQGAQLYLGKMPNSNSKIRSNLRRILTNSVESLRPYKVSWLVLAYILQFCFKVFKPNLSILYKGQRPLICSTLIQEAWERTGVMKPTNYMAPGQLVDYLGGEKELSLIFSSVPNYAANQSQLSVEMI